MQGIRQFTAQNLSELVVQLNQFVGQLQQGGLMLNGLKLDRALTTAPTATPQPNDPNVRLVNLAGVWTLYLFDGTNWVVVGTQT